MNEENCVDMLDQDDNKTYHDERVQKIMNSGEISWSGMWLEYDRDKYLDDENFIEVLEYAKNNKIT